MKLVITRNGGIYMCKGYESINGGYKFNDVIHFRRNCSKIYYINMIMKKKTIAVIRDVDIDHTKSCKKVYNDAVEYIEKKGLINRIKSNYFGKVK